MCISSSLWEDPGIIMVESKPFVGTPIISSDCPNGPKEFIGNSENGFIYNSNDEISFQRKLDDFFNTSKDELFENSQKKD